MIPEFLKPPTDNLYKFVTISGLLLFLISVTYPPWLFHRSAIQSLEAQKNSELLQIDIENLKQKNKAANDELDAQKKEQDGIEVELRTLEDKANRANQSSKDKREIASEIVGVKNRLDDMQKRKAAVYDAAHEANDATLKKAIELRYTVSVALWESWYGRIALVFCMIGGSVGIIIGIKGFNAWSLRVQVYQDAILRKQAEEIEPADGSNDS